MKRVWFGVGSMVFLVACGDSGPVSLDVKIDTLPAVTNQATLHISGTVTRTPAKKTTYVVTLTGTPAAIADTVDSAGHFAFTAPLKADSTNSFQVRAMDEGGAASPSVTVTINQDDQPPTVAQISPGIEADQVATSQTINFTLSEPVVAPGLSVGVYAGAVQVPGTLLMAADSLHGTFTPSAALGRNAIYSVLFTGLRDAAGNDDTVSSCFVTGGATTISADTSSQYFVAGSPGASLVPPLMREARWARNGATVNGVVRFAARRSFVLADTNNVSLVVDLDIDQNAATGFKSYRDSVLAGVGAAFASGIGAEYVIAMFGADAQGNFSSYAARYAGVTQIDQTSAYTFTPSVCGAYFGFAVPFTALGNDDGKMDYSLFAEADDGTGAAADVMPTQGPLSFDASVGAGAPRFRATPALGASRARSVPLPSPRAWRAVSHR